MLAVSLSEEYKVKFTNDIRKWPNSNALQRNCLMDLRINMQNEMTIWCSTFVSDGPAEVQ